MGVTRMPNKLPSVQEVNGHGYVTIEKKMRQRAGMEGKGRDGKGREGKGRV